MRFPATLATLIITVAISVGVASAQNDAAQSAPIAIAHVTLINPATSAVERDAASRRGAL